MSRDEGPDDREVLSRMEAIAYIDDLLPELITLAASQPRLQALLREAQTEAHQLVAGFKASPIWSEMAPPGETID